MTAALQPATHATPKAAAAPVVALVGNPNSGKTTLFNALTGLSARVGNYPGITVDHREGNFALADGRRARIVDLPGTYSLVPRGEDEVVAWRGVVGLLPGVRRPDLVVAVVDATNLERNLFLVTQLRELGVPLLVALTVMDTVEADGQRLDVPLLASRIGVPVVPVAAVRSGGLAELGKAISSALRADAPASSPMLETLAWADAELAERGDVVRRQVAWEAPAVAVGAWAQSMRDADAAERVELPAGVAESVASMPASTDFVERLASARYALVSQWVEGVVERKGPSGEPARSALITERIDRLALHPVAGPLVLVVVFGALFQALFSWAEPLMEAIEELVAATSSVVGGLVPEGLPLVRSLLTDGVVTGVGNVIVFVPQIAVLFFVLGILEDSGYLARAAFLIDRVMARVGLHGKAFVPLLSGFACAVPAIMAARTIESRKDRLVTILVTPLVSCSARLPVYGLMIATVFATQPPIFGVVHVGAVVLVGMYVFSLVAAVAVAAVLKRTVLRSPPPPFVLELPPYRMPRPGQLVRHTATRVRSFLVDAGTVILALTVLLWGVFNFPRSAELEARQAAEREQVVATTAAEQLDDALSVLDARVAQERLEYSLGGRLGHAIEPIIKPLGFDWKIGVGIIASFAAREVLVSTLGLVYGLGDGSDAESLSLRQAIIADRDESGQPVYTPLSALSLMVFFVLAMQCMSTLAAVRRETRSWRWPLFQFAYMTVLAYVGSLVVFQTGRLLGLG